MYVKENQIQLSVLLNTNITGIAFIDEAIVRHVYKVIQIFLIKLAKPKPLQEFDS